MTRVLKTLFTLTLLLMVAACDSRTEGTDGGGVILSITSFDGLPLLISVNNTGPFVQIGEVEVTNVPKNPAAGTSALMDVEIQSYEVTYTRADNGTRVPVAFVRGIFGTAPVNGTFTLENGPVMGLDQLLNPPLSDLLAENGGVDSETGLSRITLNFRLRFFGRTLSGDEVETAPAAFTVEITP